MTLLLGLLAGAPLVINEVCYDPPGPDAGAEFVEIFNPDTVAVSLAGCRLEFANGSGEVRWEVRWIGDREAVLAARSCYLVADTGWAGPLAQAMVALSLQNGPDAVRLVRPDGTLDILGWGDLAVPELYEGEPAADVSGPALARRPDGRDSQNNAADFQAAEPTPGSLNWPDFAPRVVACSWQPPVADGVGAPLRGLLELHNGGRLDLAGSRLRLDLGGATAAVVLAPLPADSSRVFELALTAPATGRLAATASLWPPAAAEPRYWELGWVQVGTAALQLAEVMAAPTVGGEWIEIVNLDVVPRNLADLSLRDEDGAWRVLPDLVLAPGDCRLVAQDPAALVSWLNDLTAAGVALSCEPAPPVALPGWPSLNNTAPAGRDFADRLYLADADGTVIDFVSLGLGSGRAPAGRSLERAADRRWHPATAPGGATPGCPPPRLAGVTPGEVRLAPNPFARDAGDGAVHVHLVVPPVANGYELRVFDLWGRLVRDLGGDDLGPGPREAIWDGRDEDGQPLPAGGYVAVVWWRGAGGQAWTATQKLVVIREDGR